jgi:hypothetical protein
MQLVLAQDATEPVASKDVQEADLDAISAR